MTGPRNTGTRWLDVGAKFASEEGIDKPCGARKAAVREALATRFF
jgi:hypothetical protein